MRTKKYIVELKILPYFGKKRVNDITAADIRQWQNELIKKGYSPTYLKTINNQLSAIFNYAVRLADKVMEQSSTIDRLQEKAVDLGRLERYFGREQIQSIVEQSKVLE